MALHFVLPHRERRRVHDRAYLAQQRDQSEVCGALLVDRTGHFEIRLADLRLVRQAARRKGKLLYDVCGRESRLWCIGRVGRRRVTREVGLASPSGAGRSARPVVTSLPPRAARPPTLRFRWPG